MEFLNDKPFAHRSKNGTTFEADRCDLKGGVTVTKTKGATEQATCADFAEFAAYHALVIRERINGFHGYDAVCYTFSETAELGD